MGRTGLYEFLQVDETIREMVLDRAMAFDIRRYARKNQGMLVLREEGIIRCVKGVTSAVEIMDHTDKYED
jgi:type II secretory ATPase GspE/PulE/Tfp pilus assembly ATPase PilB-like protein